MGVFNYAFFPNVLFNLSLNVFLINLNRVRFSEKFQKLEFFQNYSPLCVCNKASGEIDFNIYFTSINEVAFEIIFKIDYGYNQPKILENFLKTILQLCANSIQREYFISIPVYFRKVLLKIGGVGGVTQIYHILHFYFVN